MKRPNIDRMRKHAAIGCPDKTSREFEAPAYGSAEFYRWAGYFQRMMQIKHGDDLGIVDVVTVVHDLGFRLECHLTWRPIRDISHRITRNHMTYSNKIYTREMLQRMLDVRS